MFKISKPLWNKLPIKSNYDAVIIVGGLHGLATAYFLAPDHGMTDVAVVEKHYIGFGGSGRNTAIVRANQRTRENVPLYKEALDTLLAYNIQDAVTLEQPCLESSINFAATAFGREALHLRLSATCAYRQWLQPYDIFLQQSAVDRTP